MPNRYVVVPPTKMSWWWNVVDTHHEVIPNFLVASFSDTLKQAEMWAKLVCDRLNRGEL